MPGAWDYSEWKKKRRCAQERSKYSWGRKKGGGCAWNVVLIERGKEIQFRSLVEAHIGQVRNLIDPFLQTCLVGSSWGTSTPQLLLRHRERAGKGGRKPEKG